MISTVSLRPAMGSRDPARGTTNTTTRGIPIPRRSLLRCSWPIHPIRWTQCPCICTSPVQQRFGGSVTADSFYSLCMSIAGGVNKPLYVGEFGQYISGDPTTTEQNFYSLLNTIQATGVPLASLWVYDFSSQDNSYNVTATNDRAYQLFAVEQANLAMQNP